jgi:AMME syndrome candidate gene 1 protein
MCYHSFDVLIQALRYGQHHVDGKRKQTTPAFVADLPHVAMECPVFVTWEKQRSSMSSHWHLRGCIGTLGPRLLVDAIGEYALISALKDRRFDPITIQEVPFLRVSVSLLVQYEVCEDVYDWTVGTHGIMIKFMVAGRSYSATYLPEVAKDQKWTIAQTVASLVQKAGYHGTLTPELLRTIHCTRYQSSKCQVTYAQYVEEQCQGMDPLAVMTTSHFDSHGSSSGGGSGAAKSWQSCKQM